MVRLILHAPVDFPASDLVRRLGVTSFAEGLSVDGRALLAPDARFGLVWRPRDPAMSASFANAGLSREELRAIDEHTGALHLTAEARSPGSALANARAGLTVASALVGVDALGVGCVSSEVAHPLDRWIGLADKARVGFEQGLAGDDDGYDQAFAALVDAWVRLEVPAGDGWVGTSGMHLLGRPEVAVPVASPDRAVLAALFAGYLCRNADGMRSGQGFRVTEGAPRFVMRHDPAVLHDPADPRHNPWGTWRLHPDPR